MVYWVWLGWSMWALSLLGLNLIHFMRQVSLYYKKFISLFTSTQYERTNSAIFLTVVKPHIPMVLFWTKPSLSAPDYVKSASLTVCWPYQLMFLLVSMPSMRKNRLHLLPVIQKLNKVLCLQLKCISSVISFFKEASFFSSRLNWVIYLTDYMVNELDVLLWL